MEFSLGLLIALALMLGGWRIIRTMGVLMVALQPYKGFAARSRVGRPS